MVVQPASILVELVQENIESNNMKKQTTTKELLIDQADDLRKIKPPPNWEVSKLDVTFRRKGFCEDYAEVIYDSMNKTFYIKTDKSIIYPSNVNTTQEAIEVMKKANNVIKKIKIVKVK